MNPPSSQPHLGSRQFLLSPGETIGGRYQILRVLGTGGMGSVYLAQNTAIGQKVAIKVLESQFFNQPMQIKRFMREGRAICKIHHENVIYLSDFGYTDEQIPFIVMEYLEGEDLLQMLKREGTLAWPQAFSIMRQICAGLEAAHGCGIVHRDLKPSNCFRIVRPGQEDWIKLIDFGIAKFRDDSHSGLTQTGVVIGTPAYMSPEQARGEDLDLRSDVYSAAVILYRILCGRLPFEGDRAIEVVLKHVTVDPPRLAEAAPHKYFHPRLEPVLMKALAKQPADRFQSAKDFFAALAEVNELAKRENRPVCADKNLVEATSPELEAIENHLKRSYLSRPLLQFLGGIALLGVFTPIIWGLGASNFESRKMRKKFQENDIPAFIETSQATLQDQQAAAVSSKIQDPAEVALELPLEKQTNHKHSNRKTTPHRNLQSLRRSLKRVENNVQACRSEGGFPGQSVSVEVMVEKDGTLQQTKVLGPLAGSALGVCVRKAVEKAKFSQGEKVDKVAYKFTL